MAQRFKIFCRDCKSPAIIKKTIREHEDFSTVHCYCSNPECGHAWVANFEYAHTTKASKSTTYEIMVNLMQRLPKTELEEVEKILIKRMQAEL